MRYILAIDQGTTANTALLVNENGHIVAESSHEYPQHFPKLGYVEHLGPEIKSSIERVCREVLEKSTIKANDIAGIGITNQRETVCLFKKNGECIRPFIVWQCRRSADVCNELKSKNLGDFLHKKTGLFLDPYFSASKLLWLFLNEPSLLTQIRNGDVLFGTIDTFLCHWLSGGALHITDVTNASRTMLMDIHTLQFSDECLDIFNVPKCCLPTIVKNVGPYGKTKGLSFLPDGIPIAGMAGDQQAALFGQACFEKGDAKATYGTGCFILLNTGHTPILSQYGLLTSVAYQINEKPFYCLEGSAFIAGAAVQFLRDAFGLIKSASEVEALAKTVKDNGGVVFVPALCGLGAPHWKPDARGMMCGLERGTKKGHIARATLEGIALQNSDIFQAMQQDGVNPRNLKVDGGAARNDLLMQIQADILGIACIRPQSSQKTALGAAYLAGLSLGMFESLDDIRQIKEPRCIFNPNPDRTWATAVISRYEQWQDFLVKFDAAAGNS
jgi:glycerol kinase